MTVASLNARGFTLVELLITIAIAAILLSAGMPAFTDFLRDNRLQGAAGGMVADLAAARSEAARTYLTVSVCPSSAGTACDGADWNTGRIVYVDADGDGSPGAGEIIRWSPPIRSGPTATATGFGTLVQFRPTGAAVTAGSIELCDERTAEVGRRIDVSAAGRVSLRRMDCT